MEHFVIWSAGYNCEKYVQKHMESVNNQSYTNYTAMIVDDASVDSTWAKINKYKTDNCLLYKNKTNKKNAANIVNILKPNIKGSDIIVVLDLDDWFAHNDVLMRLDKIYTTERCWSTYGHYKHLGEQQLMIGYPSEIVEARSFREAHLYWHHLRTFKGFLLHRINNEDLRGPNGEYVPNTWDLAVGFPILEMTPPEKLRYIPEILMVYNALNPLRISRKARGGLRKYFRNKPKYDCLKLSAGNL